MDMIRIELCQRVNDLRASERREQGEQGERTVKEICSAQGRADFCRCIPIEASTGGLNLLSI